MIWTRDAEEALTKAKSDKKVISHIKECYTIYLVEQAKCCLPKATTTTVIPESRTPKIDHHWNPSPKNAITAPASQTPRCVTADNFIS